MVEDGTTRAGNGYGQGPDIGSVERRALREIAIVFGSVIVLICCLMAAVAIAGPSAAGGCGGG